MPGGAFQLSPATLWVVTQTATVTNERAAGITRPNPIQINDHYTVGYFTIRVTVKIDLPLAGVRIYGAIDTTGFPAVGTPTEALVSTTLDVAVGTGIVRAPAMKDSDAAAPGRPIILPQHLLLEYDTGATGASPVINFLVEVCLVGPSLVGRH